MSRRPVARRMALVAAPVLTLALLAASPIAASGIGSLGYTIPVGAQPRQVAFTPDGETAYVTNMSADTVTIIDVSAGTTVGTLPVGDEPLGVAVTPDGTEAWVTNWGSGTITFIDTSTNTVDTTINSGGTGPHGVTFTADGQFAYVVNYFNGVIAKFDVATRAVVDSLSTGGYPEGATLNADESKLYVVETNGDQLIEIATSDLTEVTPRIAVGDFPVDAALSPDGTEVWVTNNSDGTGDTVSVVDLASRSSVAAIPVAGYPQDIAFDGSGYAWVTSGVGNVLQKIDVDDRVVIDTLTAGSGAFGLAISADDRRLYVTNQYANTVSVFGLDVDRLAGADRYSTAVEISQRTFPSGAPRVYVATGTNYPDALAAGPAAKDQAPILLTTPTSLPAVVAAEIDRLNPTEIIVLGNTASVSAAVFEELDDIAPTSRIGGADRYATANALVRASYVSSSGAYIATGQNFPDALSAGAAGAALQYPLILVNGQAAAVNAATLDLLDDLGVSDITIVGGTATVSAGIAAQLDDLGFSVVRLGGADRFETSALISADAFPDVDSVLFATGSNFPDALAGAPLAAAGFSPILAVQQSCIPDDAYAYVTRQSTAWVTLLGGPSTLGPAVEALSPC